MFTEQRLTLATHKRTGLHAVNYCSPRYFVESIVKHDDNALINIQFRITTVETITVANNSKKISYECPTIQN